MRTATVPTDWKSANVVPIYKNNGPKVEPGNYRPISLTSVAVKIMEWIIKGKMLVHLKTHKLIAPSQHGFLPKRSTTTNLIIAYLIRIRTN